MANEAVGRAAERVARESYGRLVAYLAVRTRDLAAAEDALGEAFAIALRTWPLDGVPDRPDAWLLTVARRRLTDAARRSRIQGDGERHLTLVAEEVGALAAEVIPDRRLALMFACAHPAIDPGVRTPLILQCTLGLDATAIAAAFLLPPKTMGQRLVRAKLRIRDAGIPLVVPEAEELPDRLAAVLDAIYAAYAMGWSEVGEDGACALAEEAIWLGRLVVSLLPREPEAKGMLALMLHAEARRRARRDAAGGYVPLDEQDTSLWDAPLIGTAEGLLRSASEAGPSGRYQLEAAIQSAHVARRLGGASSWPAVVALYDHLLRLTDSPVVVLNRAVARAEVAGPDAALEDLEALEAVGRIHDYQPYWAAKAHLLFKAGRTAAAAEAMTVAIGLTTDPSVRRYLLGRRAAMVER